MSEKYGQDQPWHVTREPNVEPSYEELTDRIEELEAKLAKAVEALEKLNVGEGWAAQIARTTLAELKGKGDE
jgi:hypothetical protein